MYRKIILAGGTGYLGKVLTEYYKGKADSIVVLTRKAYKDFENIHYQMWDGKTAGSWTTCLEDADMLINLSGKSVNCRYTAKNQQEILTSRTGSTAILGSVINTLKNPPKVWLNLASATIYRHAEDRPQTENNGETGSGFSVDVCRAWEESFWKVTNPQTRKVLLRTSIVLGRKDGVFPRLKRLVQFGLGGHQGNGNQYVSWIHEHDFARITEWAYRYAEDGAVFNCTAPEAVTNKTLMNLIRKTYGILIGIPTPQWLLEAGAYVIRTETELVLKSRWVYPENLLKKGFTFQFGQARQAIQELLNSRQ